MKQSYRQLKSINHLERGFWRKGWARQVSSVSDLGAAVCKILHFDKMSHFGVDEQFDCSFGCESANQCEYNNLPPRQVDPLPQNYADNDNFYYNNNFDEGVAPASYQEDNNQQMQCYPNYSDHNAIPHANAFVNESVDSSVGLQGGNYFIDNAQTYPPCEGPQPWNYAQCYGYYGEAPCQFANVVDMEDFM